MASLFLSIDYSAGNHTLRVLNQLLLPQTCVYDDIASVQDAWSCIRDMRVRGAPAIAVVASLALGLELQQRVFPTGAEVVAFVETSADHLRTSRPTAVNLFEAMTRLTTMARAMHACGAEAAGIVAALVGEVEGMLTKDVADNKAVGDIGARFILDTPDCEEKVTVLTHCNTGSLATCGYGTALGVVRSLWSQGRLAHVYFTETRPYNQGARLTAFELMHEGIPCTLIADSMAALLLQRRRVAAVVVGADRVVANGDTANKIGTYMLALVAHHHHVPFLVAAPATSIDTTLATGALIPIEERAEAELLSTNGVRATPPGLHAWNPAFDVTPATLIAGIITEHGVARPAADGAFDMAAFLQGKK